MSAALPARSAARLRGTRRLLALLGAAAVVVAMPAAAESSAAPRTPSVEGPVGGGKGTPSIAATTFDLGTVGYRQDEFFLSGTAAAFGSNAALASDGAWSVAPAASAAFKTRIVVWRPEDPARFDGTVVVEWLNVSAGADAAPDWIFLHRHAIREGMAWVGVSAQQVGVQGGTTILRTPSARGLTTLDPERYGSLVHPGDSFSYDIFTQAGLALRPATDGSGASGSAGTRPLGDLVVERLIAIGESQSAFRLTTYINAVDPIARVYDAYLVHARGGGSAALSETPQPALPAPTPTFFRSDLRVPVLCVESETDLLTLGYLPARQPDSDRFRLWEMAGTAHADVYTIRVGAIDDGRRSPTELAAAWAPTAAAAPGMTFAKPINAGPQHWVLNAALHRLERWLRDGTPPPAAPRLEVEPGPPPALALDANGNARGGIRTPHLDVPTATLSGLGQEGAGFARLFGTTAPFDAVKLAALYPTPSAYLDAFARATQAAVDAGFILDADAAEIQAIAGTAYSGR